MIDSIHLKYQIKSSEEYESLRRILGAQPSVSYSSYDDGLEIINCSIRNLRVKLKHPFLFIRGSFPKFKFGDNIKELSWIELFSTINELSSILGINLWSSLIRRIDIGACLFMNNPVSDYLNCLDETPEFKGYYKYQDETQTYVKSNYSVLFYDKVKEAIKHNDPLSSVYLEENILRFEVQLQRRLAAELKHKKVYLARLLTQSFRKKLLDRWQSSFLKINIKRTLIKSLDSKNQNKQVNLIKFVDESGGSSSMLAIMDQFQKSGKTSKNQRKYFRKLLKKAYSNEANFILSPLLAELSDKVRRQHSKFVATIFA